MRIVPGAGRDQVDGAVDGVLRVRVAARPVEGAANEALLRLLARELGVPRRQLALRTGMRSRTKVVEVLGLGPEAIRSRWPGVDV